MSGQTERKFQVVVILSGVSCPVNEYDDRSVAYEQADRHNRQLLERDDSLVGAYLVMHKHELVRGPAAVIPY